MPTIADVWDLAAIKVGLPGWVAYQWKRADGGSIVVGCVPLVLFKSGPRKGKPNYSKPAPGSLRTVIVTDADMDAHAKQYEEITGLCFNCHGSGQVNVGWSRETGPKMADCKCCKASGKINQ